MGEISDQGPRIGSEDSLTARMLTGELWHHHDTERVPVADELFLCREGKLGCSKRMGVVHWANILHGARVSNLALGGEQPCRHGLCQSC